ncbi:hypothetical protein GWI33_016969 [Rhynchophorus ferrugineus]|uniref:Acyltransferase 3 domain-containing protein n=1 Tax=Rhynchophorus ferrugineus TaxID=354439 RepID=A0A834IA41_RHYFE|nr:hypothetical protein GWI33_016969 [Rhynchophorus ferrugineus]
MWFRKVLPCWWIIFVVAARCEEIVSDEEYATIPDVFYQDNFDKCMMRKEKAHFCSFSYKLEPLDHTKPPEMWRIIKARVQNPIRKMTPSHQYQVGTIFSIYLAFVLFASFYEGYKRNWIRLKTVNSTHEIERLRCIQGMRLYNTALVVFSHTALSLISGPVANARYPESLHENVARLIFSSGPLCVGTFFLFSTFLLSNGLFDHLRDKKTLDLKLILFVIFNRIFRLTPTVLVVVLFHATWLRHLGNGPWWNDFVGYEYQKCRMNGWTNLIYINNWYDTFVMCLPVTWYLALDTQYFVMALFFISFLKSHEKYLYWIIGGTMSVIFVTTFIQNYYHDFSGLILPIPEYFYGMRNLLGSFQFHYQVGSFIGNLSPAVAGIGIGYYFCNHKNDSPDQYIFRTKCRQTLWWWCTFIIALLFLIIPGSMILNYEAAHDRFWASMYVAISRPLFAFIIGTGLIGFSEGIGWLAVRVTNWPPTYVLGRLTFSVYLIHMSINLITPAILRYSAYVNDYVTVTKFLGDIFFIYIIATLLALFVELPVSQLQKIIFKQPGTKKKVDKEE